MRRLLIMITRRDFLKGAGVVALAVATTGVLAGCSDSSSSTNNTPAPAPTPDEPVTPAPASQTVTLEDGVTLTILGTTRANVLPNGTKQYLAVKFKLNNTTAHDVTITENNFKSNLNGKWEFPIASSKLSDSQKKFLVSSDVPYIGYYEEEFGNPFGAAGTALEAAVCYMTDTSKTAMDLYVTYGKKVFKFALSV